MQGYQPHTQQNKCTHQACVSVLWSVLINASPSLEQELMQYFRKNQVDTDQGMIQKVKGMSVDEALRTIREKILQRFRGNEASTRAVFRAFDKDGGGEVSVSQATTTPSNQGGETAAASSHDRADALTN